MMLSIIEYDYVRCIAKIIAYKMSSSSREDYILVGFINVAYKMCDDRIEHNVCEIMKQQNFDNLERIKKNKYATLRVGYLIIYIFFYVMKIFPNMPKSE